MDWLEMWWCLWAEAEEKSVVGFEFLRGQEEGVVMCWWMVEAAQMV
jgi:hypothetical protein